MKFLANARRRALTTVTVISFSLTFVIAGMAMLLGLLPLDTSSVDFSIGSVDGGVLLLVVPLLALVLAMLFEATRLALRGPLKMSDDKPVRVLSEWKPGHGEG